MNQTTDKGPYIIIVIFAFLVLAGFYIVLDKNNILSTDIKNLELQLALKNQIFTTPTNDITSTSSSTNESQFTSSSQSIREPELSSDTHTIPAAIIFDTLSSPLTQPQSTITVTIENINKTADGTITLIMKAFTKNATSYTAFEPGNLFELLIPEGENQKPLQVVGQFNPIPPKSVSTGKIIFKINPSLNTVILQVGSGDTITYYELNFIKKTYKETEVG